MALTDPYPADLDLSQGLGHVIRATVWPPGAPAFALQILDSPQLAYSRTWSPYVQASFKAVRPTDRAQLDQLDARAKTYVHLDLGYKTDSGSVVPNVAMLRLESADPNPDGTLNVVLLGMEATAQDAVWTRDWDTFLPRTGIIEALSYLIRSGTIGYQKSIVSSLPNGYRADLLQTPPDTGGPWPDQPGPVVSDGTSIWSAIDSLAAQANLKVWEDGLKVWHIETRRQVGSTPAMLLSDGPGGLVTEGSYRRSRRGWYNSVTLTYPDAPRSATQPWYDIRGLAQANGKYNPSNVGAVVYRGTRSGYATNASANAAARSLLATFLARGQLYQMEAVAAYWLRPGMPVDVRIQGTTSRQLVESVTFRPWDGLMDVETSPDEVDE